MVSGVSNIERAKITKWSQEIHVTRTTGLFGKVYWYDTYENNLLEAVKEFSANSKHVDFLLMTNSGVFQAFISDLGGDLVFIQISIVLIVSYSMLFLGSCSPIHCRLTLALVGIVCIFLSYLAGFGLCFINDLEVTNIHNLIPFLLLGIGVDDMFVLCNAVDQTSLDWSY